MSDMTLREWARPSQSMRGQYPGWAGRLYDWEPGTLIPGGAFFARVSEFSDEYSRVELDVEMPLCDAARAVAEWACAHDYAWMRGCYYVSNLKGYTLEQLCCVAVNAFGERGVMVFHEGAEAMDVLKQACADVVAWPRERREAELALLLLRSPG